MMTSVRRMAALVVLGCAAASCRPNPEERAMKGPQQKIQCTDCESPALPEAALPKSEDEWQARLTSEQFTILRRRGTERPYSGEYLHHKADGTYVCAGCKQPLYDSKTKYDSCGWPSFWDALPGAVVKHPDLEAVCSRCDGHLGHVFDDGPPPTGKRH